VVSSKNTTSATAGSPSTERANSPACLAISLQGGFHSTSRLTTSVTVSPGPDLSPPWRASAGRRRRNQRARQSTKNSAVRIAESFSDTAVAMDRPILLCGWFFSALAECGKRSGRIRGHLGSMQASARGRVDLPDHHDFDTDSKACPNPVGRDHRASHALTQSQAGPVAERQAGVPGC
jgi:hypothetical protein